jgi:hypothetical protein
MVCFRTLHASHPVPHPTKSSGIKQFFVVLLWYSHNPSFWPLSIVLGLLNVHSAKPNSLPADMAVARASFTSRPVELVAISGGELMLEGTRVGAAAFGQASRFVFDSTRHRAYQTAGWVYVWETRSLEATWTYTCLRKELEVLG